MRDRHEGAARPIRCAIYTRKSTEEGLDQDFNSLDAQREACAAYILSQRHEGWVAVPDIYDDGGYSGGNMERPALKALLADITLGKIDVIVVYKVDRLTRSLADFAKIVEVLDAKGASFVSVTQAFNTTTSMGRLTLNVLLSFAQFEREVTSERIRDKIAASKAKGMWMGGPPPLGYDVLDRRLIVNDAEAETVRHIFRRYLELGSAIALVAELDAERIRSKRRISRSGRQHGGQRIVRGALYAMLRNRLYIGEVEHKGRVYPGQHDAILHREIFDAAGRQLEKAGRERALGSGSPDPSLLAGLLWDKCGRRMSPSHGAKGSRRYRYYVSQVDGAHGDSERRWRVSASDVERHVVDLLVGQLQRGQRQLIEAGECSGGDIQRLRNSVETTINALQTGVGKEQRGVMLACMRRVELRQDALTVTAAFGSIDSQFGDAEITSSVPVSCVRSGKALKLVLPPAGTPDGSRKSPALIKLVTQAMAAREVLAASRTDDLDDLAAEIGYGREHAADLLKVGLLAPDIITAILDGRQPEDLTRTKLIRWSALPLDWAAQREVLGFGAV